MKKFFLFAASFAMLAAFASCEPKTPDVPAPEPEKPEVQTAKDNLVVYMPLESAENAIEVGEGITFASKNGAAGFAAGEIGNGYTNTSGKNDEAYLKFNLAKGNALSKLSDVTVTMWVKNIEDFQKGGLFSVNGKHFATQDWPSMVAMFDNKGVDEETGAKKQQINGRFMFKKADENNRLLSAYRPLPPETLKSLREYYRVGLTYTSNALEGNSLTESETKVVIEDGLTIEGKPLRDHYEAVGHAKAYDYIYQITDMEGLEEEAILALHRLFYQQIDAEKAGKYRDVKVYISGIRYAVSAVSKTPAEMQKLVKW